MKNYTIVAMIEVEKVPAKSKKEAIKKVGKFIHSIIPKEAWIIEKTEEVKVFYK